MDKKTIVKENYNSKILVNMWSDFIDWDKRRIGENGFLKKILDANNCYAIFESCLGDGCDTIYLLKEGFEVTSNDLDLEFIRKAQESARKESVKLNITSHDWRKLDKHFIKESFDAVLCLGNSLTYLFNKNDQIKTIKQFRKILRKDGILIIDERNYQYFLDNKQKILNGKFDYSHNYVYCGSKVKTQPTKISKSEVVMEYKHTGTGETGHLTLYPFKKDEMIQLLKEAGFTKIKQYSDYNEKYDNKADFYTYVCVK